MNIFENCYHLEKMLCYDKKSKVVIHNNEVISCVQFTPKEILLITVDFI